VCCVGKDTSWEIGIHVCTWSQPHYYLSNRDIPTEGGEKRGRWKREGGGKERAVEKVGGTAESEVVKLPERKQKVSRFNVVGRIVKTSSHHSWILAILLFLSSLSLDCVYKLETSNSQYCIVYRHSVGELVLQYNRGRQSLKVIKDYHFSTLYFSTSSSRLQWLWRFSSKTTLYRLHSLPPLVEKHQG
jgi:hypothetical protein